MPRAVKNLGHGHGDYGHRVLTGTESSVVGEYFIGFTTTEASVVSFISEANNGGGDASQSGLSLPVNFDFHGVITSITMTSGTIVAYLAE